MAIIKKGLVKSIRSKKDGNVIVSPIGVDAENVLVNKEKKTNLITELANKVSKENGKQLSEENFTNALLTKLNGLKNYILPIATTTSLGGIKVGKDLQIDTEGQLSVNNTENNKRLSQLEEGHFSDTNKVVPTKTELDFVNSLSQQMQNGNSLLSASDKEKINNLDNIYAHKKTAFTIHLPQNWNSTINNISNYKISIPGVKESGIPILFFISGDIKDYYNIDSFSIDEKTQSAFFVPKSSAYQNAGELILKIEVVN